MTEYKTEHQKKRFYNSGDWKRLRQEALKKDNYECQECKRLGYVNLDSVKEDGKRKEIKMNVHHIQEIEERPDLALDLDNLETVCLYHHNLAHGRVWKEWEKNRWADDELDIL
ncbi:HNH endonuclease [Salimicrobium album]|uniref:HNH endonuclease n=1 Tax=Salimicrobium album TaxID=50717 RepID=A0A1H3DEQ8_9BACI|nr:HNH endonuclease [Salimicrobium album]SDX64837.1 HNH endonuclease [Salimicrobium album]